MENQNVEINDVCEVSEEIEINNILQEYDVLKKENPTYVNSKQMRTYYTNPTPIVGERGISKVHIRLHGLAYSPPIGSLLTKQLAKEGKKVTIHYSDVKHSNKIGVDIDGTMETWTSIPGSLLLKNK